jgi:hypothetical protein
MRLTAFLAASAKYCRPPSKLQRTREGAELVGQSRACPFDLHALLPVPGPTLQLGPSHPDALAWLATHWGITDRLRQVVVREGFHGPAVAARARGDRLRLLHRW